MVTDRISDIRDIVGMRNRLIHGYDNVNYDMLWDIVVNFVPSLEKQADDLLRKAPNVPSS